MTLADKAFLGVFDLPVVAGRLENVIEGSGFVALEAELAESLFGRAADAIGKSLTLNGATAFSTNPGFVPAQPTDFEVAAVFALPEPVTRSTQFQALVANNDYSANLLPGFNGVRNRNLTVWFRLKEGVDPETVNESLDLYLDEYLITTRGPTELRGGSYSDLFDFRLQPLDDVYFNTHVGEFPQGDRTRQLTFGVVALLVLMAGCSNVISLGLAATMERRREVMLNNNPAAMQLVNTQQDVEGVPIKNMSFRPGLFDILGIPRLAGRDFNAVSDVMQPGQTVNAEAPAIRVIINRSAVRALGFSDPEAVISQRYYVLQDTGARRSYSSVEVIGVMEDSMLFTLRERPGAEFYYVDAFPGSVVLFRYEAAAEAGLLARVNAVMEEVTGAPGRVSFLEQRIAQTFTEEQRESRLLLMCAGLALFLSCVGLYGLVSVALKTQVKEIGVRKVLGSSTFGVVRTFLTRFSVPVLIANLIAWVTVGALTLRAASAPPVRSLRYE